MEPELSLPAVRAKADEVLAGAIARWLSDRVQVPEHRAITASFAFLTLPEIVALTSARNEADQLRARVEAVAEELEAQAADAEHLAEEHRRAGNLAQAGVFAGKKVAKRDAVARLRPAVTDTTGGLA